MKALSIRHPWAWLIRERMKDVENRTWKTDFRGSFFIHASKTPDEDAFNRIEQDLRCILLAGNLDRSKFRYGGLIAIAEIVDCVENSGSKWFEGPYGFVIKKVQPIKFIPWYGALQFFDIPHSIARMVEGDCDRACGWQDPYGFVPEAGCPVHDGGD